MYDIVEGPWGRLAGRLPFGFPSRHTCPAQTPCVSGIRRTPYAGKVYSKSRPIQ